MKKRRALVGGDGDGDGADEVHEKPGAHEHLAELPRCLAEANSEGSADGQTSNG
jgi:hypothetical protein